MRPTFAKYYDRIIARQEEAVFGPWRADLVATARGRVVEVGAGTGANLHHYTDEVDELVLIEPTATMRRQLIQRLEGSPMADRTEIVDAWADSLPVDDASVDTVVTTLVLCSVPDLDAAAAELRRVLKPGGRLVTFEHVLSPRDRPRRWQQRLTPVWRWLEGSCHLDHDTGDALARNGFDVSALESIRVPKSPPVLADFVRGVAVAT